MRFLTPWSLILLAAALRWFALPGWGEGAWVFLAVLARLQAWHIGTRWYQELVGGFLFWGATFSILTETGMGMFLGPALLLSPTWMCEAWLGRRLSRFLPWAVAGPIALFAVQFFTAHYLYGGVPWASWGWGLSEWESAMLASRSVGESGVSLLVLLLGGALFALLHRQHRSWPIWVGPICTLMATQSAQDSPIEESGRTLDALAIQPMIPLGEKTSEGGALGIFQKHLSLAEDAKEADLNQTNPDLLVWAETMFLFPTTGPPVQHLEGGYEIRLPRRGLPEQHAIHPWDLAWEGQVQAAALAATAVKDGGHFLTGAHFYEPIATDVPAEATSPRASEALLFDSTGGLVGQHRKTALVPFGETLPLGGDWPGAAGLARWVFDAFGLSPDFQKGGEPQVLRLGDNGPTLGVAICWENVFAGIFRQFADQQAEALVVLSNEAWYGLGAEMDQMLAATRFRSSETGLHVLRATNTGLTVWVDPHGRVVKELPRGISGSLRVELPLAVSGAKTPFLAGGWLISHEIAWLALFGALFARKRRTLGISA